MCTTMCQETCNLFILNSYIHRPTECHLCYALYTWLLWYNGLSQKRTHVDISAAEALVHGPILSTFRW